MGKSNRQASEGMTKQNYNTANAQGQQTQGHLWGNIPGAEQQAQNTYNSASSGYTGFMQGMGGYDPNDYKTMTSQNNKNYETGGYTDPGQLSQLNSDISRNVSGGGFTQEELSQLEAGGLGGINAEQATNIRSGYNNLVNTGGIDETTAGAMRRQAAGATQSVYATMGSNLARQQAATGMGGGGGETAEMARQASNEAAKATTGANAQIGQLRQQGTIAGLGGLSNFEQGAAAGQRQVAGAAQQGRLQGTQQEEQLAQSQASNRLSATNAQQDLATNAAQQRITSAGGLVNLYNSSPGYVNSLVQQIMQSQSVTGTLTTEQAQIMQELSKQPGLFSTIMGTITQLGGAAGGVMTGIGAL